MNGIVVVQVDTHIAARGGFGALLAIFVHSTAAANEDKGNHSNDDTAELHSGQPVGLVIATVIVILSVIRDAVHTVRLRGGGRGGGDSHHVIDIVRIGVRLQSIGEGIVSQRGRETLH